MTIQGPAIFLAQFMGDEAPFNSFDSICAWASELGYLGVQVPSWDPRCFDLEKAAKSKAYCEEIQGVAASHGLEITELSTHLQGQLVAVHPAYASMFQAFAPKGVKTPKDMQRWGTQQVKWCLTASKHMGLKAMPTFPGALMWHTVYPWPQRPAGLVDAGFTELAKRWRPILDHADKSGVDCAYEVHPGEDIHDGATYEMFLDKVDQHERARLLYDPSHFVLQCLDYLDYIDRYHDRISCFHVKDAEFVPNGRVGVYGGYQSWQDRAGRFRSLGDGEVDFTSIFTKLTHYGFSGWAVLEWECCFKDSQQGAEEGAPFIASHLITPPAKAFDDFAGGSIDKKAIRDALGL
ncbi:MAG: sugar phosphate isomerase/epimerase [Planctomycetota bacterium]|nr:sugar phosphate isomerase/epimerase [Planctomycetota bacterium]MDA0934604.1 sugar phosphate isomerase/epimerase [Planctomycetota bacterium]MDA1220627.1 sugar phosphate isomerase/epimerase [Planctomycetota bacterium]